MTFEGSISMLVTAMMLVLAYFPAAEAFSGPIFQMMPTKQRTTPSKMEGVEIELPDFDELFGRIKQVSPLARLAIEGGGANDVAGFDAFSDRHRDSLSWKTIENSKRKIIHQIDRIENFQNLGSPILRFRSRMNGPCNGEVFANFMMSLEERKQWDAQIEQVHELYPIHDLDAANIAMNFGQYGDCSRLGVGYCQTKANLGISGREQLTLCGIQDFRDGSCIIWGTEMEEWHDHLLPGDERVTRAKSHIFSTTLVPTGENSFDVEYVIQLEVGGNIPTWLTTPIVVDTVKNLFRHADKVFNHGSEELQKYLEEKEREDAFGESHSILMTM